jgi:hypothetical protein
MAALGKGPPSPKGRSEPFAMLSSVEWNDRYATLANVWATMVGIVTNPLGDANKFS